MTIKIAENPFVIFDLDDTIFPEIEYLRSAYKEIAKYIEEKTKENIYHNLLNIYNQKGNAFKWILERYKDQVPDCNLDLLLSIYRSHIPEITMKKETSLFLETLYNKKVKMGIITDGRSITQRSKLKALGIATYFSEIIISEEFGSEKPEANNYLFFEKKYPGYSFYYIGDNTFKDFIIPQKLGWKMICLKDEGYNIHKQDFGAFDNNIVLISSFDEILIA